MNTTLITSLELLQTSTQSVITIVCITGILVMAWLWLLKHQKANSNSSKKSISIKIDRNGKHHYDVVPNSGNGNLKFWIRIVIAIITLAFLWIPIKSLLNPQY